MVGHDVITSADVRWTPLPWDSDFFGVAIGRIDLTGASSASIAEAEDAARAHGLRCLYAEVPATDAPLVELAQRSGFRVVDVAMDLAHPTSTLPEVPAADVTAVEVPAVGESAVDVPAIGVSAVGVSVRIATPADVASLDEQVEAVAPWSRFSADGRFGPDAAVALHRAWVERAANGEDGRRLLVAEDGADAIGLLTLTDRPIDAATDDSTDGSTDSSTDGSTDSSTDDSTDEVVEPSPEGLPAAGRPPRGRPPGGHRRIDLIVTTRPGSGAPLALVRKAFELFGPGPSVGGPIAARNVTSLHFSEQLGYRITGAAYHLHRWLDEPAPSGAPRRSIDEPGAERTGKTAETGEEEAR